MYHRQFDNSTEARIDENGEIWFGNDSYCTMDFEQGLEVIESKAFRLTLSYGLDLNQPQYTEALLKLVRAFQVTTLEITRDLDLKCLEGTSVVNISTPGSTTLPSQVQVANLDELIEGHYPNLHTLSSTHYPPFLASFAGVVHLKVYILEKNISNPNLVSLEVDMEVGFDFDTKDLPNLRHLNLVTGCGLNISHDLDTLSTNVIPITNSKIRKFRYYKDVRKDASEVYSRIPGLETFIIGLDQGNKKIYGKSLVEYSR